MYMPNIYGKNYINIYTFKLQELFLAIFSKIILDFAQKKDIIVFAVKNFAELCKGSTADSDSVCLGSNPSSAAKNSAGFFACRVFNFTDRKSIMQLTAPLYYKQFKCIADKCRHGCCSRWEIDIDTPALEHYRALDNGIRDTIEFDNDGTAHFKLCKNGSCPHLTQNGLCSIILNHGNEYLCDICREHPRFYNNTGISVEVGLGASCEEACRLILESEDYITMQSIGNIDGQEEFLPDFFAVKERSRIYRTLSDTFLTYSERLRALYKQYGVSPDILSDTEWQDIINSLEYLDSNNKALFSGYSYITQTPLALQQLAERYLAYLIYRHTSTAETKEDFCSALGFCFFCERLLVYLLSKEKNISIDTVIEYSRIISEEIEYSDRNTDTIMLEFDLFILNYLTN